MEINDKIGQLRESLAEPDELMLNVWNIHLGQEIITTEEEREQSLQKLFVLMTILYNKLVTCNPNCPQPD